MGYHFWKGHGYKPEGGKPLWISGDTNVLHIFFDDNIHDKAHDSIVAVRARGAAGEAFHSVSGAATQELQGVLLVKAQPVAAIQQMDYFLQHIQSCEEKYAQMMKD